MENRRGPKTDPWGTPNETVLKSDCVSFKETFWRRLLRKEQIKLRVFPLGRRGLVFLEVGHD